MWSQIDSMMKGSVGRVRNWEGECLSSTGSSGRCAGTLRPGTGGRCILAAGQPEERQPGRCYHSTDSSGTTAGSLQRGNCEGEKSESKRTL